MKPLRTTAAYVLTGIALAWLLLGCGASAREKTISATLTSANAASDAFVAYSAQHQADLVAAAKDKPSAEAAVHEWRDKRLEMVQALEGLYRAIATAATLDDQPSLDGMVKVAGLVMQQLHAMGVLK